MYIDDLFIDLRNWPPPTTKDIILLIIFLFAVITFVLIFRAYYRREYVKILHWIEMVNFFKNRNLGSEQTAILQAFYMKLPVKHALSLLSDMKVFYGLLFKYLENEKNMPSEIKVVIMSNLFAKSGESAKEEIKTLSDIHEGELCGIDFNNGHYMGKVMLKGEKNITLCLPKWLIIEEGKNTLATLYFYRPDQGGFVLPGKIVNAINECLYFESTGPIEIKYNYHLMTDTPLPVKIVSWPPATRGEGLGTQQAEIEGLTKRISDKALTFALKKTLLLEKSEDKILNNVWNLEMTFPLGYNFSCKGRIIKSARHSSHLYGGKIKSDKEENNEFYIFKYIDISEESLHELFKFIRANNPKREFLY